jgi:hypothetical protein
MWLLHRAGATASAQGPGRADDNRVWSLEIFYIIEVEVEVRRSLQGSPVFGMVAVLQLETWATWAFLTAPKSPCHDAKALAEAVAYALHISISILYQSSIIDDQSITFLSVISYQLSEYQLPIT